MGSLSTLTHKSVTKIFFYSFVMSKLTPSLNMARRSLRMVRRKRNLNQAEVIKIFTAACLAHQIAEQKIQYWWYVLRKTCTFGQFWKWLLVIFGFDYLSGLIIIGLHVWVFNEDPTREAQMIFIKKIFFFYVVMAKPLRIIWILLKILYLNYTLKI